MSETKTPEARLPAFARWVFAAGFLAVTVITLMAAHLVSFDHYGGVYGVSAGTSSSYCSAEIAWPAFTCETAR